QVADELPLAVMQTSPPSKLKLALMQAIHTRKEKPLTTVDHAPNRRRSPGFFRNRWPVFGLSLIILLALASLLVWQQFYHPPQLASNSLRVVNLTHSQFFPDAVGALVINPNNQYSTLVVDNLAVLDPHKQYQVWLIKGKDRYSAGVFSVNSNGYASVEIQSPQPLQLFDGIGVSVEPAGGSPAPTGENVFRASLTK
ncbi:MAG TPA: anti-sigma factor, partial [Anaerolineales bacterium]|nr:anti-sigma factor [Anaerolineales bacterium]